MIALYDASGTCLVKRDGETALTGATVWIDLLNPTEAEETAIEQALNLDADPRGDARD